jgi:microcystin-dependent protein
MTPRKLTVALALAGGLAAPAHAATPVPHTFTAGTPAKAAEVNANFQSVVDQIAQAMPAGTVLPYAGTAAPPGFLLCDGTPVAKAQYAALYAVLGTRFGDGGNPAGPLFSLPDLRGSFVRGATNLAPKAFAPAQVYPLNGDYLALPGHGLNHTGFPVRFRNTGGALPQPLAPDTTYFAVVEGDNVKLATTDQNAFAGVIIDLTDTGSGTHTLVPAADPDAASRLPTAPGGATGDVVGSTQGDALQNITGSITVRKAGEGINATSGALGGSTAAAEAVAGHTTGTFAATPTIVLDASRVARTSSETRPRNVALNYIIKY